MKRKLNKVVDYYNKNTSAYLELVSAAIQSHRSENESDMYDYYIEIMGIQDGMKLLDAGCGVCGPAIYFANKQNVLIDAITISDYQVEIGKQKVDENNLQESVKVWQADFHKLKEITKNETYDIIYFLESYGHSLNPKIVFDGVNHALKNGGILYIKDYFKKDVPDMSKINKVVKRMNKNFAYNLPCLYSTIKLLRNLKYNIIRIGVPEFEHDNGKASAQFVKKNNIKLFDNESETFSYADIYEIIAKKHD